MAKCSADNQSRAVDTFGGVKEECRQGGECDCCDLNEEQQRAQPDTERKK
jgi:hypothetical protein